MLIQSEHLRGASRRPFFCASPEKFLHARKPTGKNMTASLKSIEGTSIAETMAGIGRRGKAAARQLALRPATQRDAALTAMAKAIRDSEAGILAANAEDVAEAKGAGATSAFIDR